MDDRIQIDPLAIEALFLPEFREFCEDLKLIKEQKLEAAKVFAEMARVHGLTHLEFDGTQDYINLVNA